MEVTLRFTGCRGEAEKAEKTANRQSLTNKIKREESKAKVDKEGVTCRGQMNLNGVKRGSEKPGKKGGYRRSSIHRSKKATYPVGKKVGKDGRRRRDG